MNFKKLLVATTMTVALASCSNGGGAPSKNKLFADIKDFLESREVVIDEMPYIDSVADTKVLHTESFEGDEEYVPYFYFVLEGDVLEPTFAALKAAEWTVPSEMSYYGYECFNKEETIEIDIFYSDEADEENGVYVGTNYYVYANKDLDPSYDGDGGGSLDGFAAQIANFLATRGVTISGLPYFETLTDSDIIHTDTYPGDGYYVPYFYFVIQGDKLNDVLGALRTAGWTVPSAETEYGYECIDPSQKVEIDIFYAEEDDIENDLYAGTNCTVYAYADLTGGDDSGDDSGDDDLSDPKAEAVALEIATNIFGADLAEENIGWFFAYYVSNTVDGTDLLAAVNQHVQYVPEDFIEIEEPSIQTETDEDDGSTYQYGFAQYLNEDFIVVEICTFIGEDDGKIDVTIWVYSFEDDEGEEESSFDFSVLVDATDGKTDAEATSRVVDNTDDSKTATLDFTSMAHQATFCKQTVGDLSVKVMMGENKNDRPAYFTTNKTGCVNSLRIYWGTALKFTVPQGHSIEKIEFDSVKSKSGTILVDKYNLAIDGGAYTVSNNHVTITADENVDALIMAINFDENNGHIAFANISITYK